MPLRASGTSHISLVLRTRRRSAASQSCFSTRASAAPGPIALRLAPGSRPFRVPPARLARRSRAGDSRRGLVAPPDARRRCPLGRTPAPRLLCSVSGRSRASTSRWAGPVKPGPNCKRGVAPGGSARPPGSPLATSPVILEGVRVSRGTRDAAGRSSPTAAVADDTSGSATQLGGCHSRSLDLRDAGRRLVSQPQVETAARRFRLASG
jgi:hypothetical protein